MKLSGTAVIALLAASATAADWSCQYQSGGGSHAKLKSVHRGFNRAFGNSALTMAPGQCYYTLCEGFYFGVCNHHGVHAKETSNARNIAKDANPENGARCVIQPTHSRHYLRYYFTPEKHFKKDETYQVIREC